MEMEERTLQITTIQTQAPVYLRATGLFLLRYGLAAMMLLFGLQKWTKAEAEGNSISTRINFRSSRSVIG